MCDLRVHLGPDPTAGLDPDAIAEEPALTGPCVAHFESAVFDGQFLTCQVSGSLADARWTLGGPGKLFVPYVKVCLFLLVSFFLSFFSSQSPRVSLNPLVSSALCVVICSKPLFCTSCTRLAATPMMCVLDVL